MISFLGTSILLFTVSHPLSYPSAVENSKAAVQLVRQVYAVEAKHDPNLRVQYDHSSKQDHHTVYVIQVFDAMRNHTATMDWVDVRDDGTLKSEFFQSAFGTQTQYKNTVLAQG